MRGQAVSEVSRDLVIPGMVATDDERDTRITGTFASSRAGDLYITGQIITSTSVDLRLEGLLIGTQDEYSQEMMIVGEAPSNTTRDIRITSGDWIEVY